MNIPVLAYDANLTGIRGVDFELSFDPPVQLRAGDSVVCFPDGNLWVNGRIAAKGKLKGPTPLSAEPPQGDPEPDVVVGVCGNERVMP